MTEQNEFHEIAMFLEGTDLFTGTDYNSRLKIAQATAVHEYPAKSLIIKQGGPADAVFIIARGSAAVLYEDDHLGLERKIAVLGINEAFGESSLILGEPHAYSVRAIEDSVCVVLGAEAFQRIVMALPQVLLATGRKLAEMLKNQYRMMGFKFVRLMNQRFQPDLYKMIPRTTLEKYQIVPLAMEGESLVVAMTRPNDPAAMEALRSAAGGIKLQPVACGEDEYLRFFKDVISIEIGAKEKVPGRGPYRHTDVKLIDVSEKETKSGPELPPDAAVKMVNELLAEAVNRSASDIHIEPGLNKMHFRLRVDGRLTNYGGNIDKKYHAPLINRLKVMANIDISEKRRPQDGRASIRVKKRTFDLRINTLPTLYGEKMVLRVLDPEKGVVPVDQLILSEPLAATVRRGIARSSGCIVIVGPTGSGKTTTLYSALNERKTNEADINIVTVEDPVEYSLEGITQAQVSHAPGMGFSSLLRALLRQDPDVIMIGETRDTETAKIALEAALTGHLVLTTLHADTALEVVTRLVEMGCARYLVSSVLDLVVAQRLVRRICKECSTQHTYSSLVLNNLEKTGVIGKGESNGIFFQGKGCGKCGGSGYLGRTGVYEILRVDEELREAIGAGESEVSLTKMAMKSSCLTTFKQYGNFLLKNGQTTPSEVLRLFGTE